MACAESAEWGDGLMWVNLDGKKIQAVRWVGGNWTGASYVACDLGPRADANVYVYTATTAASWMLNREQGELRLCAMMREGKSDKRVVEYQLPPKINAR